jgi:hypothetical protein
MKIATLILQNAIRLLALVLIVLGFQFWTGRLMAMVPIHMRLGETLIALLWIMAAMGLRANVSKGLALGALLYGFFVFLFAMNMGRILPGPAHEAIRALHFLFGLGAIGLAETIGGRIKRSAS